MTGIDLLQLIEVKHLRPCAPLPLGSIVRRESTAASAETYDQRYIQFLEDCLTAFNQRATGIADGGALGLFIRDRTQSGVGGAFGWTWGGTCFLRSLYLPGEMRHKGYGTALMHEIEQETRRRGCTLVILETFSFQARGFYEKLGFSTVSQITGYPQGHEFLTLRKRLA
jgi:GNAT superfamily N-acetyltransferase